MKPRLLLPLLLLSVLPVFGDELFYRSNGIGMLLERIEPYRRDESRLVVGVLATIRSEVRRLYDKGREKRRWEISWTGDGRQKVERELADGVLAARRIYDAGGDLLQEEQYDAGVLAQKSVFTYSGGRLSRLRVLAPDGKVVSVYQYLYATSGTLREVRRTGAGGDARLSAYVVGPAGVSNERTTAGDALFIARYDTLGRVASRETQKGDETVSREDFTFRPNSDHLLSSLKKLPAEGKLIDRRFDEAGRPVSETTRAGGTVVEEIAYARDAQGGMTGKIRRTAAGRETWKYTLGADGKASREEYFRRGSLEKVTAYGEGKLRTDELYRDGELFLKVFFDADTRLREEVYEGGKLLRERKYP
jgi:antitoxin component YwqK of YwqJK toxin-antitoxin module